MTAAAPTARPDMRCSGTRADFALLRPIPTRWQDNDTYGHVNNVVYYSWFDTAVNATLVERGVLDPFQGETLFLVVASGCVYHKPVSFPETLEAGLRIARLGTTSVHWEVAIFPQAGIEPAAEGHFVHVNVDRVSRLPVAIDTEARTRLADLVRNAS